MAKILIVDDEPRIRDLIASICNTRALPVRRPATAPPR